MNKKVIKHLIEFIICASLCAIILKTNDITIIALSLLITFLLFIENFVFEYYFR